MMSLINPVVTIGADPDLLGSSGTAKVAQIAAKTIGIPMANIARVIPSPCRQPQYPTEPKARSSKTNLKPRFNGCDPNVFSLII